MPPITNGHPQPLFLAGLFDDLTSKRLEIDVLEITGPVFAGNDSRLWCLESLRNGMSHGLVFDANAQVVEPSTPLHKRPLLVQRTLGGHPGPSAPKVFQAAREKLLTDGIPSDREPLAVLEINTPSLGSAASDNTELLGLIEQLAPIATILVTNYPEGYQVLDYVRRYTAAPIRVIIWISMFLQLLEERMFPAFARRHVGKLRTTAGHRCHHLCRSHAQGRSGCGPRQLSRRSFAGVPQQRLANS